MPRSRKISVQLPRRGYQKRNLQIYNHDARQNLSISCVREWIFGKNGMYGFSFLPFDIPKSNVPRQNPRSQNSCADNIQNEQCDESTKGPFSCRLNLFCLVSYPIFSCSLARHLPDVDILFFKGRTIGLKKKRKVLQYVRVDEVISLGANVLRVSGQKVGQSL